MPPQEAYSNLATLEARLQEVARDMVSNQHGRRYSTRQGGQPGADGFPGQQQPMPQHLGNGLPAGNPFMGDPGQPRPLSAAGQPSAGLPGFPASAGQPGYGLHGLKAESPQVQPGSQLGLPAGLKTEPGLPLGASRPGTGNPAAGPLPSPNSIAQPGQPMMSNGAPVLLREQRNWAPGQTPGLQNVSASCSTAPVPGVPLQSGPN